MSEYTPMTEEIERALHRFSSIELERSGYQTDEAPPPLSDWHPQTVEQMRQTLIAAHNPDRERAAAEKALAPLAALVEEVAGFHDGRIGTHERGCYQYHAGCLALRVQEMITEEAPDAN